jgi:NAD(P)-dependent dehydrogenase (short-subunit alcohol dehydrogenase family)
MRRTRFRGRIAGTGTTSGVRVVVGRWTGTPLGAFADVMVETAEGHRVLLAPSPEVADFVAATYTFDEVRIGPVDVAVTARPDRERWVVTGPSLDLDLTVGRRTALGRLLRLVPARLARTPAWCTLTDPVARVLLRGVRTRGSAGGGRREWYGATDAHAVVAAGGRFDGGDLGRIAPVDPPCRFGFGSTPRRPTVTTLVTTVDVPADPAGVVTLPRLAARHQGGRMSTTGSTRSRSTLSKFLDSALDRTVAPGYTRLGLAVRRRLADWPADPAPGSLSGRVALVTGATSGLGLATATGLARLGAAVRLVVRDEEKGARVAAEIREAVPDAEVTVHRCDVADLDDVRRLADELLADPTLTRLDVVVHNAGVMPPERTESPQGHELSMSLHVLGPVLMTELLLPLLEHGDRGGEDRARVVLVTSGGMYAQRLRDDDPDYRRGEYAPTTAYARSKRAQVELLPRLDERWRDRGVAVHAMHPGWADTPGVVDSLPLFHKVTGPLLRDADEGADTTVWLAGAEPAPEPGQLWQDRRPRPAHLGRRTRPAPGGVERMWAWVLDRTGLA